MPREILKSPAAEQDLIDIWLYTADRWGVAQADAYLDQIDDALKRLLDYPKSGVDSSDIRSGYRRVQVGRHLAFYRITSEAVEIVRILHASMDAASQLDG